MTHSTQISCAGPFLDDAWCFFTVRGAYGHAVSIYNTITLFFSGLLEGGFISLCLRGPTAYSLPSRTNIVSHSLFILNLYYGNLPTSRNFQTLQIRSNLILKNKLLLSRGYYFLSLPFSDACLILFQAALVGMGRFLIFKNYIPSGFDFLTIMRQSNAQSLRVQQIVQCGGRAVWFIWF